MFFIPFNSRDTFFKSKFGAIKTNEPVTFRLLLPRSFAVTSAHFMLKKDGEDMVDYEMRWAAMNGWDKEEWEIDVQITTPGLYFYHFDYESSWGRGSIFLKENGVGAIANGLEMQSAWQLTVYDAQYKTPDFMKGGILYQIFPDRFYASEQKKQHVPKDRILRTDRENQPYWKPNAEGKVLNNDYFGGDLEGIRQKLPYLASLGVTCIYLNPIFEAHSNHRYNTADYEKIDPLLGTEQDFTRLCAEAKKQGISILLDGVFSHTGADSRYFNRDGRYDTVGAYNSEASPYYPWYSFSRFPDRYKSWWGFESLPEVKEESPAYMDFINGENGIVRKWLRLGAAGWRLDVADELPDSFIAALSKAAKAEKKDAFILGEVWEDATTKCAYGKRRKYLLGGELDSVMNYPFAAAILNFARSGLAESFEQSVMHIVENYPKPALDTLMNHIGTHDTARAITRLVGEPSEYRDRAWQSKQTLSPEAYAKGVTLLQLAAVLQYTLPGVPCLYYGDEAGMQGYKDPFNRGYYPWGKENPCLLAFYKKLGRLRRELPCFVDGEIHFLSAVLGCVAYERENDESAVLIIANRNEQAIDYQLPHKWQEKEELLHGGYSKESITVPAMGAVLLNF